MRVLVAPDKFKGCLAATEAAAAIARGVRAAGAEADSLPVADGGEGTLDALVAGAGGEAWEVTAEGPLGAPVHARIGRLQDGTVVVEMAQASGLGLVLPTERDPMRASSRGTGELIKDGLGHRPRGMIVGIGGSATVDGGMGLAGALGLRFLDSAGKPLSDGGGSLSRLARIDASGLDRRLAGVRLIVAVDVMSPLLGPNGAAHVFGPQKGASAEQVERLEEGLRQLAECLARDLGRDVRALPGAGAAGGVGAMLAALGGEILLGVDIVLETVGFAGRAAACQLVITGEGRLDEGSLAGKAPVGVARAARDAGIPCVAIVGDATTRHGFENVWTLVDHFDGDLEAAKTRASEGLAAVARKVVGERIQPG